jgi:hypothetical protein
MKALAKGGDLWQRLAALRRCILLLMLNLIRRSPSCLAALAVTVAGTVAGAQETPRTEYQLRVALAQRSPHIEGVVHVRFTNTSRRPLEEVVLVRFAERFALPDPEVDDFNRPFVYPYLDFDPGRMDIVDVRDDNRLVPWEVVRAPGIDEGVLLRARIARLLPGAQRTVTVRFRTVVPERFGPFGRFENQLTLTGGWYPYLPRLDASGTWRVDEPPPMADFDVHVRLPRGLEIVINGQHFSRGTEIAAARVEQVPYIALVAAPEWERREATAGSTRIVLLQRPPRRAQRLSLQPKPADAILAMVQAVVADSAVPGARPVDFGIVFEGAGCIGEMTKINIG